MTVPPSPNHKSLVQRTLNGDAQAGDELLETYPYKLRRMIALRLDRRVDPSDIVQEALLKARTQLPKYLANPRISIYPWLRRIAFDRLQRVHRDHIQVEKRSVNREHAWRPNLNDESVADLAHQLVTSAAFLFDRRTSSGKIGECK